MPSPTNNESTWDRLPTARTAPETGTTTEEHAASPTKTHDQSRSNATPASHDEIQDRNFEDHCTSCGRSTAAAKTLHYLPFPNEDKSLPSEFKGLHIDISPSCICELPDKERDERVPTPDKERAYGSVGSADGLSSERPVGEGYDTDDYEDYPSPAPKSPRDEDGKPSAYPEKSPLVTPSADLSASPYFQEHARSSVLPSPTVSPTARSTASTPAAPIQAVEGVHGEDIAFSRYAEEHKRLGDTPSPSPSRERVPVGVAGETRELAEVPGEEEHEAEHEKKAGFVEKVAHLLKGESKEEKDLKK